MLMKNLSSKELSITFIGISGSKTSAQFYGNWLFLICLLNWRLVSVLTQRCNDPLTICSVNKLFNAWWFTSQNVTFYESCNLFKYPGNRYKMHQLRDHHLQTERQNLRDYTRTKDESLNSQTPERDENKTSRFACPGARRSSCSSALLWKHDRRHSLEEKTNYRF